jgi:hypothetical protein
MFKNEWKMKETQIMCIATNISGVKTEQARLKRIKRAKNLSSHNGLLEFIFEGGGIRYKSVSL